MFTPTANKAKSVNKTSYHLELLLADQFKKILEDVPWLRSWQVQVESLTPDSRWDVVASGKLPNGKPGQWNVECRSQMAPSQFDSLKNRVQESPNSQSIPVLAAPRISPRMAELCQQNGWSWYDLAGNCHLELPPFLFIERTGLEPVELAPAKPAASLGSPEASLVIRALLTPAHAGRRWTQRQVVELLQETSPHLMPSLALVNKVVQAVRSEAYVASLPDRGFRVVDPVGLLQAWCSDYSFKRHVRKRYFTLLQGMALRSKLHALGEKYPGEVCYMAFSAAEFQAAHVRQPKTWLYLTPALEEDWCSHLEARSVDSGENVVIFLPGESGVFYGLDESEQRLSCTSLVQTYADLIQVGGRGEEAASALLEQRLKPAWKTIEHA